MSEADVNRLLAEAGSAVEDAVIPNGATELGPQERAKILKHVRAIVKVVSSKPCYQRFQPHLAALLRESGNAR